MERINLQISSSPQQQLELAKQQFVLSAAELQQTLDKWQEELVEYSQKPGANQRSINLQVFRMKKTQVYGDSGRRYNDLLECVLTNSEEELKTKTKQLKEANKRLSLLEGMAQKLGIKEEDIPFMIAANRGEGARIESVERARGSQPHLYDMCPEAKARLGL